MTAIAAFTAAGLATRAGCGCQEHKEQASGAGTAAALAVHRFLEGAAIALAGSAVVALALTAHAFGEGLATGALLGDQPRRRVAGWLALMCLSPVIGAAAADAFPVPAAAEPVLLAVAAGVLAQAARISLRAAFRGLRPARLLLSRPAAATTMAAIVTVRPCTRSAEHAVADCWGEWAESVGLADTFDMVPFYGPKRGDMIRTLLPDLSQQEIEAHAEKVRLTERA